MSNRQVGEVMEAIAKEVPKEQEEAHRMFTWMRNTWGFRPPEFDGQCWAELSRAVNNLCNYPTPLDTEWKIKIVSILMNEPEDKVRSQFGAKKAEE